MKEIAERITIDDNICNGKPTIRGRRISVLTILEFLSAGGSVEDVFKQYPSLEEVDILACLKFAGELMNRHFTIRPTAT